MSSHRRATKYFSRKFNARKALFRGLIVSLVEHGRIKTTVEKAKEIRRHVEKAVTLGKKDTLASRRLLLSRIPNQQTVSTIIGDISKRFASRPGGYTRIIKIGRRPGDTAEMAFLEFVDYDFSGAQKPGSDEKAVAAKKKTPAKASSTGRAKVAAKKKSVKSKQKKSRQAARV
jgi:large subunit ribosomal protein L17